MTVYDKKIPELGDLDTKEMFMHDCEAGGYIDDDGYGHPVKGKKMCEEHTVKPSRRHLIPEDATHIVWFNR